MRRPHKMIKHTQTILQQQPMNRLSVFDHFVGLTLKGLTIKTLKKLFYLKKEPKNIHGNAITVALTVPDFAKLIQSQCQRL